MKIAWMLGLLTLRFTISGFQSSPDCRIDSPIPERLGLARLHVMCADSAEWVWERPAHVGVNQIQIFYHPIFQQRYAWAAAVDSAGNEQPRECSKIWTFP